MTITPEEVAKLAAVEDGPLTQIEQLRLHIECDLSPPCLDSLLDEIDALEAAAHDMAALIARMDEALKLADELALLVNDAICDGCPACGGDCASANPPITLCPQRVRQAALSAFTEAREKLK